jgi:hypothetical protein
VWRRRKRNYIYLPLLGGARTRSASSGIRLGAEKHKNRNLNIRRQSEKFPSCVDFEVKFCELIFESEHVEGGRRIPPELPLFCFICNSSLGFPPPPTPASYFKHVFHFICSQSRGSEPFLLPENQLICLLIVF